MKRKVTELAARVSHKSHGCVIGASSAMGNPHAGRPVEQFWSTDPRCRALQGGNVSDPVGTDPDYRGGSAPARKPPCFNRRSFSLIVLTLTAFSALYARTSLSPIQESLKAALRLTDDQLSVLQGPALAVPVMLASVPLGFLVDRRSRSLLILFAATLETVGTLISAFARGYWELLLSRSLISLCVPATWAAASSLVSDLYPAAQRGKANMVIAIGQVAGGSAAFAAGGYLIAVLPSGPQAWRYATLAMCAPLVIATLIAATLKEPRRMGVQLGNVSARQSFAAIWRLRDVVFPLLVGIILVEIADGAVLTWVAPSLARSLSLSSATIGFTVSAALLGGGILGPVAGGTLTDLLQRVAGPRGPMHLLTVLAIASIPAALFPLAPRLSFAAPLLLMFLFIGAAISVSVTTLITVAIPNDLRGLTMTGLSGVSILFGLGASPLAVSVIAEEFRGAAAIPIALSLVCAATSAAGAIAFAVGAKRYPQRT